MPTTTPVKLRPPPAPLVLNILPSAFSSTGFHRSRSVAKENA